MMIRKTYALFNCSLGRVELKPNTGREETITVKLWLILLFLAHKYI